MRFSLRLVTSAMAAMAFSLAATAHALDDVAADEALARLKAGNARFVTGALKGAPVDAERRAALVAGQSPFAIVLSCADSRVPPEFVFDAGLGELFVVRTAGEVTDRAVLASIEYAAEHLHTALLLVLGHESCGAVKAAAGSPGHEAGPNLEYLVKQIRPAVDRAQPLPEAERLRAAILSNVEVVINEALVASQTLSRLVQAGTLQVVGGYYELASGRVTFTKPIGATGAAPTAPVDHRN
jgi:carbonic anhydrase